ncbi:MbtH family NRPS accessory protein [Kitasatospora sp. GP82]|uniref:MbtH family protein n=1 Tax=Kitasatospora sp. GP82 TaxID=3035089 RepID=UPI00247554B4|nr:MbtH family NRPS accessory protein [Kitasatospora sp. GP82]
MVADEDATRYQVVLNGEGQYSVWSADRELPAGWSAEGTVGGLEECTDRIDRIWTDLRPLSLVRLDAGPRSERTQ